MPFSRRSTGRNPLFIGSSLRTMKKAVDYEFNTFVVIPFSSGQVFGPKWGEAQLNAALQVVIPFSSGQVFGLSLESRLEPIKEIYRFQS